MSKRTQADETETEEKPLLTGVQILRLIIGDLPHLKPADRAEIERALNAQEPVEE